MSAALTVWVVDDDESIRWVLERSLSRENMSVQVFPGAAELLALGRYRLTQLLRGQRGTEHRIAAVLAGADIVVLNGPLAALGTSPDLIGRPFRYRIGSAMLLAATRAAPTAGVSSTAERLTSSTRRRLTAVRETIREIVRELRGYPELEQFHSTTGTWDLVLQIREGRDDVFDDGALIHDTEPTGLGC